VFYLVSSEYFLKLFIYSFIYNEIVHEYTEVKIGLLLEDELYFSLDTFHQNNFNNANMLQLKVSSNENTNSPQHWTKLHF